MAIIGPRPLLVRYLMRKMGYTMATIDGPYDNINIIIIKLN